MRCRIHSISNQPTQRNASSPPLIRCTSAHAELAARGRWPSRRAVAVGAAAAVLAVCMAKSGLQKARAKAKTASQEPRQALHQGAASGDTPQSAADGAGGRRAAAAVPKLVAFDLDGTLWWPEMYMLSGVPFKAADREGRAVTDRSGEMVRLMGASHDIMRELVTAERFSNTSIAYVSRCDEPRWADACLRLFQAAPGVTLKQAAEYSEIYYGTKTKHFRAIHKASGIPYRDMVFWDNERGNCRDVAALGVTCVYTPEGMTRKNWEEGLQKYAKAASAWTHSEGNDGHRASSSASTEDGDEWGGIW